MILTLIIIFVIGYLAIAMEHTIKVNKTASALLLGMLLWALYTIGADSLVPNIHPAALQAYIEEAGLGAEPVKKQALSYVLNVDIVEHLGEITQTLFFLIGAMTIVELIDVHDGFSIITSHITVRRKKALLFVLCGVTFFMSAVLDNLTTTIVMLMLLRKIIKARYERWLYAGMIVIAANTGGAWSPIGDVTTIMLWVKGNVTSGALISYVLLPSLVACALPMVLVARKLHGTVDSKPEKPKFDGLTTDLDRKMIFAYGIAGLLSVPLLKSFFHIPPFIGILFVLGILWVGNEIFYIHKKVDKKLEHRLGQVISRIDMSTILFFFGILMAVAVLQCTGILSAAAGWLDREVHNVYIINIILGLLSSIVDNVPLVAAAMGMYPVEPATAVGYATNFMVDGTFWEFLSYCAGVGGSTLIIGSAAGVIAMGIEGIPFGWYLRKFSLLALIGYLAGAGVYILETWLFK